MAVRASGFANGHVAERASGLPGLGPGPPSEKQGPGPARSVAIIGIRAADRRGPGRPAARAARRPAAGPGRRARHGQDGPGTTAADRPGQARTRAARGYVPARAAGARPVRQRPGQQRPGRRVTVPARCDLRHGSGPGCRVSARGIMSTGRDGPGRCVPQAGPGGLARGRAGLRRRARQRGPVRTATGSIRW